MLDSGATHSFIHPSVVCSMFETMSKGALLTVTVANGKQVECSEIAELDLVFQAQDGEHQVRTQAVLYVLEGLLTDAILGMDFLKWYNPSIGWFDSLVGMLYLVENDGVCQSILNLQGGRMDGIGHARMATCSSGVLCKNKVLVSAEQTAESIKVNVVSAKAFVNILCNDDECVMWCMLVGPIVNQATGVGVDAEDAALCDEYQDVFQEPGMLPHQQLDHVIDLIDGSLLLPKHRQCKLSQAKTCGSEAAGRVAA